MDMTIHQARHDELSGRVDHLHIAAACGNRRCRADSRDAVIFDADDAVTNDLTVDGVKDGPADDMHEAHWKLPQEFAWQGLYGLVTDSAFCQRCGFAHVALRA